MKKKELYLTPTLQVQELDLEDGLLQTLSAGSGDGDDMSNPDFGQNPFSVLQDPLSSIISF